MATSMPRLDSLLKTFHEIDRVMMQGGTCRGCVFFEAPLRGGWRHCALNMGNEGPDDGCEEWEPRLRKTRAGQKQLPLDLAGVGDARD